MAMPVRTFDCRFGWGSWERRQSGDGEQEVVRGTEQVHVGVDGTVGSGQEEGGVTRVVDGDVG